MIECKGIHKNYGTVEVLRGVDLKVAKGEVVTIVGPSGAGKSTMLQIMGTLLDPDSGTVRIAGTDVSTLRGDRLARFRGDNIGFVFQVHHLLPEFTALENVCLPAYIAGRNRSDSEKRAGELLDMLSLSHRIDHKPAQLSGGEQQRVAVARALINAPGLLLADEPSGNLDSRNREELHALFFSLRDRMGLTTVIVTHDDGLSSLSDRKITMIDGKISE